MLACWARGALKSQPVMIIEEGNVFGLRILSANIPLSAGLGCSLSFFEA
jgi:hypothetical protein